MKHCLNISVILETTQLGFSNQMPFPASVVELPKFGGERYHGDLVRLEKIHYERRWRFGHSPAASDGNARNRRHVLGGRDYRRAKGHSGTADRLRPVPDEGSFMWRIPRQGVTILTPWPGIGVQNLRTMT